MSRRGAAALLVVLALLFGAGVGVGALIWAGHEKEPSTQAEVRPPKEVTLALSKSVWHCIRDAQRYHLRVTSTTGGVHAPGSYHYSARAVDVAGLYSNMVRMQRHLYATRRKYLEVIGPVDNMGVNNGVPFRYNLTLLQQHENHVHCAGN